MTNILSIINIHFIGKQCLKDSLIKEVFPFVSDHFDMGFFGCFVCKEGFLWIGKKSDVF